MAVQLFAYVLSIAGFCGLILATFTNEWKVAYENNETTFVEPSEGLWMKCGNDGQADRITCSYTSILHQPVEIQVAILMMFVSIVLSGVAAVIAIGGLRCTKYLDGNDQLKNRVAFTGGSLYILSGLCALAVTSWYMNEVVQDFYKKKSNEFRYGPGYSLIGGFFASLFCLFGGVVLCVCSVTRLRSSTKIPLRPISKSPGKEYV